MPTNLLTNAAGRKLRLTACLALACLVPAQLSAQATVAYSNGQWFNGRTFEARTMYSAAGVLRTNRPAAIDTTIDLQGGYVIPPLGEAHNHNVEGSSRTDAVLARYISEGIFYVQNPNSLPRSRELLAGKVNQPQGIDVTFANGGLNVTGGHPWDLVERNISRGSWQRSNAEGAFYHTIDDRDALIEKWPRILAARPDFIEDLPALLE